MVSILPAEWQQQPPASSMRIAQYVAPGDQPAELIVFYFGQGRGGGADLNIARWVSQFRPVDGKPPEPRIISMKTNGELAL